MVLLGIIFEQSLYSQKIKVTAHDKPINQILIEVRDLYHVKFSFNDAELSKYKITVSKSFKDTDQLLEFLLKNLPFSYEKLSGVYIILPKQEIKAVEIEKPKVYFISGRIMEFKTNEFLPYSQIIVNSFGIISDQNGNFIYSSTKDSIFTIKVSQLGYAIKDTIIYSSKMNVPIYLIPVDQLLKEITVNENLIESFLTTGSEAATIKLNHKVTKYLPGSSDNSVFNLLRLQPGILASGEQSNDVVIWSSYAGQSRILFDGFTLFGLKNYNDNISPINPLIVKNIQIKKGGYDTNYGDCVGGIVDISGKDGNTQNPHIYLGINNFTMNGLLEIPVLKKSSLQLAYRQTYYNLYKDGIQVFPKASPEFSNIYIYPDYSFRDYNIKYTVKTDKNFFYASFYKGNDNFTYSFNQSLQYRNIIKSTTEDNHQTGASFYIEKKLNERLNSGLTISYSNLTTDLNDQYNIYSTISSKLIRQKESNTLNRIAETKANLQTVYQTKGKHAFELNLQALNNMVELKADTFNTSYLNQITNKTYYTAGLKDIIRFSNNNLNLGFRTSYLPYINKTFIEPRISFSQNIGSNFKLNLAWGIYKQYLVKSSSVDEYGNYRYFWTIADNEEIPILHSNHYVSSFSYNFKNFSANIDAFYKNTTGITRFIENTRLSVSDISQGKNKTYGIDLYTKYNLKKHTLWISYSLSKSTEHFDYFKTSDFLYAPQDQRHEIKLATIINLEPFYLSANYVYGTGFLKRPFFQNLVSERIPYSRLDISATYQFTKKRNLGEIGISILNVLNTNNQKYSNFEKVPLTQTGTVNIYFEAMPFTPTLFLKLYL